MRNQAPIVGKWLRNACEAATDLVFPPRCGCCGSDHSRVGRRLPLCAACYDEIRFIDWPVCPRCAAAVPTTGEVTLACNHCRNVRLRFDRTLAIGSYEGRLREWITHMKEDRTALLPRILAEITWQRLGDALSRMDVDVVSAVPMSLWRQWRRGVNPPREIAERLAGKLGRPAASGILRTLRNIPPQKGLSRPARFRNVSGEMAVRPGYSLQAAHVLLVDDILTTGATASEAARALKKAGAATVTVLVLARTPTGA